MKYLAFIGVGNRAGKYLSCLPEDARVAFLVDPDPVRLTQAARKYHVPEDACFQDADSFFAEHRAVDGVVVTTPDRLHYAHALASVRAGYPVLLEKPAATSPEEFDRLLEASQRSGVPVSVCLVMRYHPFFRRIREIVESGEIGRIVSIEHTEFIGPDRMAHTFVRGLWSRVEDAGPIFLSKCCHDADFLMWLTGGSVEEVHSSGVLRKFRMDRAPYGATARCTDCPVADCPYSAVRLYRERREWVDGFDVPPGGNLTDVIDAELLTGRYGRCVYRCDNNVYDTQDVEAALSTGTRLHMHLEGTSLREGRTTRIIGTKGILEADGRHIVVPGLIDEDYSHLAGLPLHAGADKALVEDFFYAVSSGRAPFANLSSALEGHRLCFAAV